MQPESAIGLGLASLGDDPDGFAPLLGGMGSVDLSREPDAIRPVPERLRVFAGYSGWGEGQLEGEIVQASWFVVDADAGDAWTRDPSGLWRAVLRRQRGRPRALRRTARPIRPPTEPAAARSAQARKSITARCNLGWDNDVKWSPGTVDAVAPGMRAASSAGSPASWSSTPATTRTGTEIDA